MTARLLAVLALLGCGSSPRSEPTITNRAPSRPAVVEAALAITAVTPERGDVEGGTYVTIKGRGFLEDGPRQAKVYFGSRQGSVVRFVNDGELIVQAPGGKPGEKLDVLVVFDPGGEVRLKQAFELVEQASPPP